MATLGSYRKAAKLRGTATIEAVMALLVFVLIWAGIHYMGGLYEAQLRTESEARTCAWLISAGACEVEIQGCSTKMEDGDAGGKETALQEAAQSQSTGGTVAGAVAQKVLDSLDALFGRNAEMTVGAEVTRPELLGGKTAGVSSSYRLPCNTKARNTDDLSFDLMDALEEEEAFQ